jgi:hypothetical protein
MWMAEWTALAARISTLMEAGTFLVRTIASGENDNYGMSDELLRNAGEVVFRIRQFRENIGPQLPTSARDCLDRFVTDCENRFGRSDRFPGQASGLPGLQGVLTMLGSFRAEFSYLLAEIEAVGSRLVIRSLKHLQRSIVADSTIGDRWRVAFDDNETACEKLGACQFLLHGVWAFKTSATGERTDLVLGVPLSITNDLRAAADVLVLTEWKKVLGLADLEEKANQAYKQASRYSSGILGGFELSSRRYLIMVSKDYLPMPDSRAEGAATYEFVNVAVDPSVPSAK